MEIFNVGIGELLVILVIMYVLLGPQGMLRAARWLGHASRQVTRFFTESWRSITDLPMDIRELPRVLLEESGLEETFDEIKQDTRAVQADLDHSIGPVNRIALPGQAGAKAVAKMGAKAGPVDAADSGPLKEAEKPVYDDKYGLKITPVQAAVAADSVPSGEAEPEGGPPKRKPGRPRKYEPRPEPSPDQPKRKRGRPRKNRPEATALEDSTSPPNGSEPPVKERPSQPAEKLPRRAPSQPGDPVVAHDPPMPLDQDENSAARAFPSGPAPASQPDPQQEHLPPEENSEPHDV